MSHQSKKRGESLLEAIIAISVIITTLTYSGTVFIGSVQTLSFSRERAAALFLAQEGIEGVKNIVGSNVLRLSGDRDLCWHAGWVNVAGKFRPVENAAECTSQNAIGDPQPLATKYYRLFFDDPDDLGRSLFRLEAPANLQPLALKMTGCQAGVTPPCFTSNNLSADVYRLRSFSINGAPQYRHTGSGTGTNTNYYRGIVINYPNVDTMEVTSRVMWVERGKLNTVERIYTLTKDHVF